MNIWLINHYAVPPKYYPLARQTYFAKFLMAMGHTVTIFAASSVHNSDVNLITDGRKWREETVDGVHYVYIKCCDYQGSDLKRIYNICEFAWKLPGVCKHFAKPDAIVATSMPPTSCAMGVHMGRKWGCKTVAEIADLWPESIVAYGIAGPHNLAVIALRWLEKWIYKKADAVVFTMEGAYDYIVEQGWEKEIPRAKVHYINNGVDLEQFDYNKEHFRVEDPDLDEPDTYKIIYVGSLRKANDQIFLLMDAIGLMQGDEFQNYRFLIYGKGELQHQLQEICEQRHYTNVLFKGFIEKKYIPYILSRCDLNVLNCASNPILRYGGSQNKLFDYLASGHPVLSGENGRYSVVAREGCGICREMSSPEAVVAAIREIQQEQPSAEHIRKVAEQYDFKTLTKKLLAIIEGREYV